MLTTGRHRHRALLVLVAGVFALSACGADRVGGPRAVPPPSTGAATRPQPAASDVAEVALLSTATGVTAVAAGTADVRWSATDAVAALDGSAVFARDADRLVRLDPATGAEQGSWPVDPELHPVVVAPDGAWVALTDQGEYTPGDPPAARTQLVVLDGRTGITRADLDLDGDIEPEAFSPAGDQLVVLHHRGETYRVETLVLRTGELVQTIDENKNVVGDMAGRRVKGVLSADRRLLATLYRTGDESQPGAFVHVLHLDGWAYCVGLPAAFGRGDDGSLVIERDGDDIVVISEAADQRATFSLADLTAHGSDGVRVPVTQGAGARADAAYRDVPGFRSLVALRSTAAPSPASPPSAGAPG